MDVLGQTLYGMSKEIAKLIGKIEYDESTVKDRIKSIKLIKSSTQQGDDDMKHIRKRTDGRWEFKKSIDGKRYYVYAKTQKELLKKIKQFKPKEQTNKIIAIDFINQWYNILKKDIKSHTQYSYAINRYFKVPLFNKELCKITYLELETFLRNINKHRTQAYCYYIIKGIYETAYKQKIVKEDISRFITKPKNKTVKGENFNLKEQESILSNLDKTPIKNEILFYLLTGCRRSEAIKISINDIDYNNNKIYVPGTKTDSAKRYVPISETYKQFLKINFKNMFKLPEEKYTREFSKYLKLLKIKNHKLHDLRHTFSTNLYYLGVPDKERQYYLGHSSIVMTNDIYTHLDPKITKQDILNLYKDLYPKF